MSGLLGDPSTLARALAVSLMSLLIAPIIFLNGSNFATAEPAILLTPSKGTGGTVVRVDGFGFVPSSVVTVSLNGGKMDTRPFAITANADGEFVATFDIPHSIASGTYPVVANGHGLERVAASSTFQVTGPNSLPVADSQSVIVDQTKEVNIQLKATDPDADELTYSIVDQPLHGTIDDFDANAGSLTFTPSREYEGNDRFTFRANDGMQDSFLAEVSIKVLKSDGAPRMENMALEMQEDMQLTILLRATNDDSSALRFQIVEPPKYGSLGFIRPHDSTSASVTYAPSPNFNGTDSFTAKASDTRFESELATVTILVTPVQDSPTANGAQISTTQEEPIEITLTSSDPDGDVLAYSIESPPSHGTLMGTAPNLRYLPSFDFRGWDSFTFKVNDGIVDSNTARVEIEVKAPTADGNVSGGDSDSSSTTPGQDNQEPVTSETPQTPPSEEVIPPAVDPVVSQPSPNGPMPNDEATPQEQIGSSEGVAPRMIFPATTLIFDAESEIGAKAVYNIVAIDAIDGIVTPDCSPASGSEFPVGKVNVVCTATDSSGNTALGSFVVEVRPIATQGNTMSTFPFDSFEFEIPDMQFAILPIIIAALVGIGLGIGLRAARKTRTKSSQPQKSY